MACARLHCYRPRGGAVEPYFARQREIGSGGGRYRASTKKIEPLRPPPRGRAASCALCFNLRGRPPTRSFSPSRARTIDRPTVRAVTNLFDLGTWWTVLSGEMADSLAIASLKGGVGEEVPMPSR